MIGKLPAHATPFEACVRASTWLWCIATMVALVLGVFFPVELTAVAAVGSVACLSMVIDFFAGPIRTKEALWIAKHDPDVAVLPRMQRALDSTAGRRAIMDAKLAVTCQHRELADVYPGVFAGEPVPADAELVGKVCVDCHAALPPSASTAVDGDPPRTLAEWAAHNAGTGSGEVADRLRRRMAFPRAEMRAEYLDRIGRISAAQLNPNGLTRPDIDALWDDCITDPPATVQAMTPRGNA